MPKTVAVMGLGYVGLPVACLVAKKGFKTHGLELNPRVVDQVNQGKSHIRDPALIKAVKAVKGKLVATSDTGLALSRADIVLVCVPTPVTQDKHPDLGFVESACRTLARHLRKGMLVVIESTVYPGVTDEIVKPLLEQSGLRAGKDFGLVHCPERIDPGNQEFALENIPRVVGGVDEHSTTEAVKFYRKILAASVTPLNSIKAAEAVKIMENTFRDVNIAFINEIAMSFDKLGIDVLEVIKGCSTKPFGFMPFYPGPGVGGTCIPKDPYYLIERAREKGFEHRFVSLARSLNNAMPVYAVSLVEQLLASLGKPVETAHLALLGLSYKADVDDVRESPALEILRLLSAKNKSLKAFDPFVPGKSNVRSLEEAVQGADCVLLATNHRSFVKSLSPRQLKAWNVKAVFDARNALDKEGILAAGIRYKGIGR